MTDSLEKIVNKKGITNKVYNKSKKFFAKAFTCTSFLALPLISTISGCGDGKDSAKSKIVSHSSLPSDVQQLTLDELRFNDPIWCGALVNKDAIGQLSEGKYKSFSTGGLIAESVDAQLYHDESWARFLTSFGYLKRDDRGNFSFGGKINDLITKSLLSISYPLESFTEKTKRRIRVEVAKRKLESITKVEHFNRGEFKVPIVGNIDREVYTFVLHYTIEPLIPEVPKLNENFIGRGTATKNINTDKWEVERRIPSDYNSKLFDKGLEEFGSPISFSSKRTVKVDITRSNIAKIGNQIDMFKVDHGRYPEKLEDLLSPPSYVKPGRWPSGGYRYIKKIDELNDAWGNRLIYQPGGTAGVPYDLISLGADAKEGGNEDAADIWNHDAGRR